MAQIKVLTLERLQQYDVKIKDYVDVTDAKSLKSVEIKGNVLKFYKEEAPVLGTAPAFEITLPETDLSNLIEKIDSATAGDVVIANADGTVADGGIKLVDLAKKSEVEAAKGEAKEYAEGLAVNYATAAQGAKADTALQKADIAEGLTDGAISVKGEAVSVHGLGTAAFKDVEAFDGAGEATKALEAAKAYADEKVAGVDLSQVDKNKTAIEGLTTRATNAEGRLDKIEGEEEGSIKKAVADAKAAVEGEIGVLTNLETTNKANIVSAINEVKVALDGEKEASVVTVSTETTTSGMAKSYTFTQNEKTIATIDIPKDMVVKSGEVITNPEGQDEGTYLVLTIANAAEDKLYVNVGRLVDVYKAKAQAAQVQIAIDSSTREISATIVAGSIGTVEIADGAIVTAKIADGTVTKDKLDAAVQASLGKADTALQEASVAQLRDDVAEVKTSLAEGGATATAIADAKKAGLDAVSALEKGQVTTNKDDITAIKGRLDTIEATEYVPITKEEVDGLFAAE